MKQLIKQFSKYSVVGTLTFCVDFGLLYLLTEYGQVNYWCSSGISFTLSILFNYFLSMKFVFERRTDIGKGSQFFIFIMLNAVALVINQKAMLVFVERLQMHYLVAKIFATFVITIWNFTSRKLFLEEKNRDIRRGFTILSHFKDKLLEEKEDTLRGEN